MTNEEAIKHLNAITKWTNFFGGCYIEKLEAIKMAVSALDKQGKYRWHDLRKNQKDLPQCDDIICCYEWKWKGRNYELGYYDEYGRWPNQDEYDMKYWKVVAWRNVEPFEEQ